MPFKEVPLETVAERNAVFLALVCRDVQPYLHYDQPIDGPRDQRIPRVLMLLRWDGRVGFPGGFVDEGETLRRACVREALEEIALSISEDRLLPVCSHLDGKDFATHLYAVEVSVAEFTAAERGARSAEHFEAEVCGVLTPNLVDLGADRGIDAFRRMPFSHNAGDQFDLLVERLGLLPPVDPLALEIETVLDRMAFRECLVRVRDGGYISTVYYGVDHHPGSRPVSEEAAVRIIGSSGVRAIAADTLHACEAAAYRLAEDAAEARRLAMPIKEKGPWEAGINEKGEVHIASDDFTHDVVLSVSGDFWGERQRLSYAQEIARRLNSATPKAPLSARSPARVE